MVADISDLQRIADHRGGRFDSGLIVDADEFAARLVEGLERLGLAVVGFQTGQDGFRRVILADAQFAAAEVTHALDFRGVVDHVEGTAAGSAGPPAAHTFDDDGVKVEKVNTIRMQGKAKRQGAYPIGRRASWKKAMVKLTPDSKSIEFFEGMV